MAINPSDIVWDNTPDSNGITWDDQQPSALQRLGNTLKGVVGAFGSGAEDLNIGITSGIGSIIPGLDPVEKYAQAQRQARAQRESAGIGYTPQNTYQGAAQKAQSGDVIGAIGEAGGATLEAGAGSVPGMATIAVPFVGLPVFWGAQTENMARTRAENSGRKDPNATDYAVAGSSAVVQAYLERLGIKGLENNPFVAKVGDGLLKKIGVQGLNALSKGLNEGVTEAGQQVAQYIAEVTGTDKPFDWGEMARQAAISAAGGVGVGTGLGAAHNALQRRNTQVEQQASLEAPAVPEETTAPSDVVWDQPQQDAPVTPIEAPQGDVAPQSDETGIQTITDDLQAIQDQNAVNDMMVYDEVRKVSENPDVAESANVGSALSKNDIARIEGGFERSRREWIDKERETRPNFAPDVESRKELLSDEQRAEVARLEDLMYKSSATQGADKKYAPYKLTATDKKEYSLLSEKYRDLFIGGGDEYAPPAQTRGALVPSIETIPGDVVPLMNETVTQAEVGSPGAAKDTEVSSDWEERTLAGRMMDAPKVSEQVKRSIGKSGELYYQPVSHLQTDADVLKFMEGKDPLEMADLVLDANAPMSQTTRNRMAILTSDLLESAANELEQIGDEVTPLQLRKRAAEVSIELARWGTEAGRSIEVLKTFDPNSPEKIVGNYKSVVDQARKPYKKIVDTVVEAVQQSDGETADKVAESTPVKEAVRKVVRKKSAGDKIKDVVKKKLRPDGKVDLTNVPKPNERGLWDAYVAGFGKAMDNHIANLEPKQRGELENFARDVKRLFVGKLPKANQSAVIRSSVSAVRSQIANINEMRQAWQKARDIAIKKSSDPVKTSELIKPEMGAPFSIGDLRKVMRELGYFNVKNISKTWGADRDALTQTVIDVLMQDQTTLNDKQTTIISEWLRKSIGSIIDAEKTRMAEHQQKLAEARAARESSRQQTRPASSGESIGDQYMNSAAKSLAGRLSRIYESPSQSLPALKELMNEVVSALGERIPRTESSANKKETDYKLITDAINNRDKYVDIWERARALALEKYPERSAEINKVFDDLDSVVPMKAVRGMMEEEMDAMGVSLRDIIREHYTTIDRTGKTLGDRIAYRLNISLDDARHIASVVQAEFVRQSSVARAKALANLVKQKPFVRKSIQGSLNKIIDLVHLGALDDESVYNAIAEKNHLPKYDPDTVARIRKYAFELKELAKTRGEFDYSIDFYKKMGELEKFMQSLYPSNITSLLTGVGSRLNMLASPKSAITNIIGNTVTSISESLARRIEAMRFNGLNGDFALRYIKYVNRVYKESGYDPSRMAVIETDPVTGEESFKLQLEDTFKTLGESDVIHAEGEGSTRKLIRIGQDIIFKKALGAADVLTSAAHFADMANILSTTMARQEGHTGDKLKRRALEIFKDAVRIEPITMSGHIVRVKAIKDAMRATLTDNSSAAKFALKTRSLLDHIKGVKNLNIGELNIPFAKTPANIVMRGFESGGLFLLPDIKTMIDGKRSGDPAMIAKGVRGLSTAGLGMLAGFLLSLMFEPEDYIGEYWMYDPKEKALIKAKGGVYNSVKVGNYYVSLDYLGGFASPLVGMLMARKMTNKGVPAWEVPYYYYRSVVSQAGHIPGVQQLADFGRWMFDKTQYGQGASDVIKDAYSNLLDFASARVVPAVLSDIAKAFDPYERQVDYKSLAAPVERIAQQIPGARETLPVRVDMFGDPIQTQGGVSTLAFGARLRAGRNSMLINELQRLNEASELPAVADIQSTNDRVKRLRDRIGGEQFDGVVKKFNSEFKDKATKMMNSGQYQRADDAGKKKLWESVKNDAIAKAIGRYAPLTKK